MARKPSAPHDARRAGGTSSVIGDELYGSLDELRRFRHLFRNAYVLSSDPDRLAIALKHARRAELLHRQDIERFLQFLDALVHRGLSEDPAPS